MSVIPKVENTPVTVQHLDLKIDDEGLPISVIVDGKIQKRNLHLLGKDRNWLLDQLSHEGIKPKEVIFAYMTEKKKNLIISKREEA